MDLETGLKRCHSDKNVNTSVNNTKNIPIHESFNQSITHGVL